jgi:hypothetical protein
VHHQEAEAARSPLATKVPALMDRLRGCKVLRSYGKAIASQWIDVGAGGLILPAVELRFRFRRCTLIDAGTIIDLP